MNRVEGSERHALELKKIRRARSVRLSLAIAAGAILGNAGAYLVYQSTRGEFPPREEARLEATSKNPSRVVPIASADRQVALDAIARGDYELAVAELSTGLQAPDPDQEVKLLLKLVQNLMDGRREAPAPTTRTQTVRTQPSPPEVETPTESVAPEKEQEPEADTLVLVTTVPHGLTVKVDGEVRGTSPARIEVEPGRHFVAVFKGGRRLMRRSFEVKAGTAEHINADLRNKLRARESPPRRASTQRVDAEKKPGGSALGPPGAARVAAVEDRASEPLPSPESRPVEEERSPEPSPPPNAESTAERARAQPKPEEKNAPSQAREPPQKPVVISDPSPPQKRLKEVPTAVLQGVIDRQGRRVRACYEARRWRRLELQANQEGGQVLIHLVVSPAGDVKEGRIESSTLDNPRVERCIENMIRKLNFPPSASDAEATFAMRFGANAGRVGKVPMAVLKKAIDRQRKRIQDCYTAKPPAAAEAPRVVIHLVVSRAGKVQDGSIERSTLNDAPAEQCIEKEIRKLTFPRLSAVAEATFTMRFDSN